MDERIERFRRRVVKHFGGRPGRGARYPEDLRVEAVAFARLRLEAGESVRSAASELGLAAGTLSHWLEAPPAPAMEWRAVEVVDEEAAPAPASSPPPAPGTLILTTARGHRLEGLSLDEAALLLEALG